jgi:hypothetical protein
MQDEMSNVVFNVYNCNGLLVCVTRYWSVVKVVLEACAVFGNCRLEVRPVLAD